MFRPGDGADLASAWHKSPMVEAVEHINVTHAVNEARAQALALSRALAAKRDLARKIHAIIEALKKRWQ